MKIKEIAALSVPQEKIDESAFNPFGKYILRPISFLVTKLLLNTRITPNQVSAFSLFCAVIGFIMLCIPSNYPVHIGGMACFFLWNILDCVDGGLARIKKIYSDNGDLWDSAAGYAVVALLPFGISVCGAYELDGVWSILMVVAGGLIGLFNLYPRLLMYAKKVYDSNRGIVSNSPSLNEKGSYGVVKTIGFNLTGPDALYFVIALLSVCFHFEILFVISYFFIFFFILIYSCISIFKG